MNILKDVNLGKYSSMGLGGDAKYLVEIKNVDDIKEALEFAEEKDLKVMMIGGGNNIIFSDKGFEGLILINDILGIDEIDDTTFKIGAGEDWDQFVRLTVDRKLSGIECLSKIPGKMGSAPIQNIGAYGQEIKDTLVEVEVFNSENHKVEIIENKDCEFEYRNSKFKKNPGKYFILNITLKLNKEYLKPPFYESLQKYIDEHKITDHSPANIRRAVVAVRMSKLPDPNLVKNCGSFFVNPIIDSSLRDELIKQYPDLPNWEQENGYKVSAAWLLSECGFKDYHYDNGMATWKNQPLVVVNEHAKSVSDLLEFKEILVDSVKDKFNIELKMEPVLI